MPNKKLPILLTIFSCILALTAFDNIPGSAALSFRDTIRFVRPANFPAPVYAFKNNPITKEGFLLGKALFYDPLLSVDQSVSCASCHQASAAFANLNLTVSTGVKGCVGKRNAPPLFNLAWQKGFMWDGRIDNMHDVPVNALTNPCEMATDMKTVLQKLRADSQYPMRFKQAFGTVVITDDAVLKALAQFTAMMISANSRYDRHMRHEAEGDFNAEQEAGYLLFKSACSSCHSEPLFTDGTYRNNGLDEISADIGRDSTTHAMADRGRFRVPSLRNVEITRPYMHDGRFYSLKQVLQHYSAGMKNHANLDPLLKRNGRPGIPLTALQQGQLIAFLKTLTDIDFINDPRFNNH